MSTESATIWWLQDACRLGMRWVGGYIPTPADWPQPRDLDRLGRLDGISLTLRSTTTAVTAVDYYRRGRRRTPVGAEMNRFKYQGDLDAGWRLVAAATEVLYKRRIAEALDIIVPILPLPIFRDFQPSLWLARQLGSLLERPVIADIVRRTRPGLPQKSIPLGRRKKTNVAGLWELDLNSRFVLVGRRVLLIDDVINSGETLLEMGRVLREAGAEVISFAFVKTGIQTIRQTSHG